MHPCMHTGWSKFLHLFALFFVLVFIILLCICTHCLAQAGEALGAIGAESAIPVLERFLTDAPIEVCGSTFSSCCCRYLCSWDVLNTIVFRIGGEAKYQYDYYIFSGHRLHPQQTQSFIVVPWIDWVSDWTVSWYHLMFLLVCRWWKLVGWPWTEFSGPKMKLIRKRASWGRCLV